MFSDAEFLLADVSDPIRGSFLQAFKFIDRAAYISKLIGNLRRAFEGTVNKQDADVLAKLSKVLERHANVVIRSDNSSL